MKAVAAAFNQEKVLVGAFSVNVKTDCGTDGSFYSTRRNPGGWTVLGSARAQQQIVLRAPLRFLLRRGGRLKSRQQRDAILTLMISDSHYYGFHTLRIF